MSRFFSVVAMLAALTSAVEAEEPIRIAIAGDSTARNYAGMPDGYSQLHGWGEYLAESMSGIEVLNHAIGGRSSKNFLAEGRWGALLADKPDYVLIQFGHNDNPNKGPERETLADPVPGTLPTEGLGRELNDWFRHNLRTYILEARQAGAVAVIVTPMERRAFKTNGPLRPKNKPWADAALAVARELEAPVIDLNGYSVTIYNQLGLEGSLRLHPQRDGQLDNTHYNETGSRLWAEFILEQLGQVVPELAPRISLPPVRALDRPVESR